MSDCDEIAKPLIRPAGQRCVQHRHYFEDRNSPTRLGGGPGCSRTRFAGANSPESSSRPLNGVGIIPVTDFTAGALQAHQRRIDADSEHGRDLRQRVSLNIFQEKHVAVSLGQPEGTQQG